MATVMATVSVMAQTVIIDDHFDDGDLGVNVSGTGAGFLGFRNITTQAGIGENAALSIAVTTGGGAGGTLAGVFSKDAVNTDWTGAGATLVEWTLKAATPTRAYVGLRNDNNLGNYEYFTPYDGTPLPDGRWHGLWVTLYDGDDFAGNAKRGNLIFFDKSLVQYTLASWNYDTFLDGGSLVISLALRSDGYSLEMSDAVTVLHGALAGSFPVRNGLSNAYVFTYQQNAGDNYMQVDRIVAVEGARVPGMLLGGALFTVR
jgi:hypothetical protein